MIALICLCLSLFASVFNETLVRWHRAGFRCYWPLKSRPRGGRPQIETNLRALIQRSDPAHLAISLPMARGACTFRQRDVTAAVKAVVAAGVAAACVEVANDGKITIIVGRRGDKTADGRAGGNEWDSI